MYAEVESILAIGHARALQRGVTYFADLTPTEAWAVLQQETGAVLVDVRTEAEIDFVGYVPDSIEIPLKTYPDMMDNPSFTADLAARIGKDQLVVLICRSGVRSVTAAETMSALGYTRCVNVLEGIEGEMNELGQRRVNGWKMAGLPWVQS